MTDDPLARNRLAEEASPYLQQHADNPVNWQPWDETALEAARQRDRPIFLSIGYSSCHWCHVMAEESFEDDAVAEVLNEEFVPIKVDREERPDIDSVYQTLAQVVSGRGGWPLSVWLTPDQRPFHVGTYFPREPRRGMPGFLELLGKVRASYTDERAEIDARADEWTAAIEDEMATPSGSHELDKGVLTTAADTAVTRADREHGGFGSGGPKFPQTGRIRILLRAHERTGRAEFREVAVEALDAMVAGGIYDHVGGGFHRYATDREWIVPHFEKMLYDNAEIPRALLAGYRLTGEQRYATVARETFEFLRRDLRHPDGGLYSTLDARSPPAGDPASGDREGAFYTWTPADVRDAVEDSIDAELFCDRYGVTASGNFEGETVLTHSASLSALANERKLDRSEVKRRLESARTQVFDAREQRPRPNRDEKVLAGWNGLAISALAAGGFVLDRTYAATARDALSFCREHLWDESADRLYRRYKDEDVRIDGYLEDYAFLARGAFDTYQTTGNPDHLSFALALGDALVERFWDTEAETLYFTAADGERLIARPQELSDQSTPSSVGVAVETLLALDHFRNDSRFEDVAAGVLETNAETIERDPLRHASLTLAADRYRNGSTELTVAAESIPEEWHGALAETYLPAQILTRRPPTADGLEEWTDRLGMGEAPPIWAGRDARDGRPTVYACRDFACSPPKDDIEAAIEWLSG